MNPDTSEPKPVINPRITPVEAAKIMADGNFPHARIEAAKAVLQRNQLPGKSESLFGIAARILNTEASRLEKEGRKPAILPITPERLGEALDEVWNDHCGDAGCIPSCIKVHGPRTTTISADFAGSSFVELVAENLATEKPEKILGLRVRADREGLIRELEELEAAEIQDADCEQNLHGNEYKANMARAVAAGIRIAINLALARQGSVGVSAEG